MPRISGCILVTAKCQRGTERSGATELALSEHRAGPDAETAGSGLPVPVHCAAADVFFLSASGIETEIFTKPRGKLKHQCLLLDSHNVLQKSSERIHPN